MDHLSLLLSRGRSVQAPPLSSSTQPLSITSLQKFDLEEPPPWPSVIGGRSAKWTSVSSMIPPAIRRQLGPVVARSVLPATKLGRLPRDRGESNLYPEIPCGGKQKRRQPGPVLPHEKRQFDDALYSSRTRSTRKSHLKKVAQILRTNFARETNGLEEASILRKLCSGPAVKVVSEALSAEEKSSGDKYLSTWKTEVEDEVAISAAFILQKRKCTKALRKFGSPKQAEEFPLGEVVQCHLLKIRDQCVPDGPIYPVLFVAITSLIMLRCLAARSFRRNQVKLEELQITIIFGTRKSEQSNLNYRLVPLTCICEVAPFGACPHCLLRMYLKFRDGAVQSPFLFCTKDGRCLTVRGVGATVKLIMARLGLENSHAMTPHSMRISGARHWSCAGLSEESIMALGDWRTLSVLRRYVGLTGLPRKMIMEMNSRLSQPAVRTMHTATLPHDLENALMAFAVRPKPEEYAVVTNARRPHMFHRVLCHGPSLRWRTECGQQFNPRTMHLQRWSEFDADQHEKCSRRGCGCWTNA